MLSNVTSHIYMFLNCWNVLWRGVSLKYWEGLISHKICVVDIQYLTLPWCQATITSHLIFLNVQVQCQTPSPPHLFVWKYGESTKFLTHFLLANQISGVLYLSFHSKDVFLFYATLLLPQHFSPPSLRSCWSKGLGTACWSTLSPTLFGECAKHSICCQKHGGNCCCCSLFIA